VATVLEFETKVADFVRSNRLLGRKDNVLLAVSGGADSVSLLYLMQALKTEGIFEGKLVCAHINHQLRGADADQDEEFVAARANELNVPVKTKQLDVRRFARENKLSIETAGRQLRMESLLEIAQECGCKTVATAHHKNDNAETMIQRMLRGTGFRGLGGIWPVREFGQGIRFVRPLLCVTRDEIIEYLRARNLKCRVDHTNFDGTYRRNFIRHRLLPLLQEDCRGGLVEQLAELSHRARRFYHSLHEQADMLWAESADCSGDTVVLDLKEYSARHPGVKAEVVRRSRVEIGSGERDLTQGHYETVLGLARQNVSGRRIVLPNGFVARREYGKIIFSRTNEEAGTFREKIPSIELKIPGETSFGAYLIEASFVECNGNLAKYKTGSGLRRNNKGDRTGFVEGFDSDKLSLPLMVRSRASGDRFWPLGLAGEKKVGKFLTSAKIPHQLRQKVLVIADTQKIIWVWPIRMSEQAKVDSGTRRILQLKITDKNEP
jgi:tRNA(Ile)-lysidine synthase